MGTEFKSGDWNLSRTSDKITKKKKLYRCARFQRLLNVLELYKILSFIIYSVILIKKKILYNIFTIYGLIFGFNCVKESVNSQILYELKFDTSQSINKRIVII